MTKWDDIPAALKMTGGALVGVMAMMAYLTTYQSDAEAQQYQQQSQQQIALFRVQDLENQIAQYRYQLLSSELTPQQREWIQTEIQRLERDIACIRNGTC